MYIKQSELEMVWAIEEMENAMKNGDNRTYKQASKIYQQARENRRTLG